MKKIAIIVGSLQKNSLNRHIAEAIQAIGSASYALEMVEIADLPMYNQDLDNTPPQEWVDFRKVIAAADGVLFVTPEHNRSFPAALKNALDVASRPWGMSVWNGKPAAIVSVSPGAIGGFGANHHLRQVLAFLNMPTLGQPEAYIGVAHTLLDENGGLKDEGTRDFLKNFLTAFEAFLGRNAS
jgi:chromate reductase